MAKVKTSNIPPRFKRQRRLGTELPGLGKLGALDRRAYPPGQHGNQRRKLSEYALRLEEKQKVIFHYGIREEQLRRFVRQAKAGKPHDWVDSLIGSLESRVDNIVFRLGFAPSMRAARQLVGHGHVLVDGKSLTVGSSQIMPGSKVTLTAKGFKTTAYMQAKATPRLEIANYLLKEGEDAKETGTLRERPTSQDIPFAFEKGLLAEYYAARSA